MIKPDLFHERYIAYFDLLGIREYHRNKSWIQIYARYEDVVERASDDSTYRNDLIEKVWFSDSFIFLTRDNTKESFLALEQFSRKFIYFCLSSRVPLRGAISYGESYFDSENNILFGSPLIEAYEIGEGQDWIGLVYCKSAEEKIISFFDIRNSLNYTITKVQMKEKKVML